MRYCWVYRKNVCRLYSYNTMSRLKAPWCCSGAVRYVVRCSRSACVGGAAFWWGAISDCWLGRDRTRSVEKNVLQIYCRSASGCTPLSPQRDLTIFIFAMCTDTLFNIYTYETCAHTHSDFARVRDEVGAWQLIFYCSSFLRQRWREDREAVYLWYYIHVRVCARVIYIFFSPRCCCGKRHKSVRGYFRQGLRRRHGRSALQQQFVRAPTDSH